MSRFTVDSDWCSTSAIDRVVCPVATNSSARSSRPSRRGAAFAHSTTAAGTSTVPARAAISAVSNPSTLSARSTVVTRPLLTADTARWHSTTVIGTTERVDPSAVDAEACAVGDHEIGGVGVPVEADLQARALSDIGDREPQCRVPNRDGDCAADGPPAGRLPETAGGHCSRTFARPSAAHTQLLPRRPSGVTADQSQ